MEEKVIKPHYVKPMIEKAICERLENPKPSVMINIKPEDVLDVRKVSEEVVRATLTRNLLMSPVCFVKMSVTMSIDIPIDSIEFSKLDDPKEYIKNSHPVKILASYISNLITTMTANTFLGPIVTPPVIQE